MSRINDALRRATTERHSESALTLRARFERPIKPAQSRRDQEQLRPDDYPAECVEPHRAPASSKAAADVSSDRASLYTVAPPQPAAASSLLRIEPSLDGKLVSHPQISQASVEQYRRLATSLHQSQTQRGIKILMVSSAHPGEGKTLTCVNLALTLSNSFQRRVLLIDGDLRKPSIHQAFGISNSAGLNRDLLLSNRSLPLVQVAERLTILPATGPEPNPSVILTSDRMQHLMSEASERFDWILLDSPPVGLISDANLLAALVDGILLVIGAQSTSYRAVEHAIAELGRDRILGTVLNRIDPGSLSESSHYHYSYGYGATYQDEPTSRLV